MAIETFIEIQRQLDARFAATRERYEQAVAEYERLLDEVSQAARQSDAPPVLRTIQHRVDRGELTWDRAVTDGAALDAVLRAYPSHQPETVKGRHTNG